jgi:predicted CXXCH cytochrome family protein
MTPASGALDSNDIVGPSLLAVHPFSFSLPINSAPDLVASLSSTPPKTADTTGAVKLIKGNVECTSCHNAHVQNIDATTNFLVIDNSGSALCLSCHSPVPSGTGMGMAAATTRNSHSAVGNPVSANLKPKGPNPLEQWTTSAHAIAQNKVAPRVTMASASTALRATAKPLSLGNYKTVAKNGCQSCHESHNAQSRASLLREADDGSCIVCHNGSTNISPAAPNVLAEMSTPKIGHAFAPVNNLHQANEDAVLNQNRHALCVDCHNPHSSNRVTSFADITGLRPSQNRVVGVSATDGVTVLTPAVHGYENCLRCHGTSTGKQAKASLGYLPIWAVAASDPLNLIPQFSTSATSSHPVMHDRSSAFPQFSLRNSMLNLDGSTQGRIMGSRILCTDCHNSDDNREFGGTGPNGPHGSMFSHVLERQYLFSQAPGPGMLITNLSPNPNLSAAGGNNGGPYALCAKCHDLRQILSNSSFSEHARHINDGFSCSVCHTAHGMGATSGTVTGERLVNFDTKVVAPLVTGGISLPISYSRATNSCALVCHGHVHKSAALKASVTTKSK